ncbi:MAG TPA: tRNA (adenosine(37)-N6)-dimethylallyltransferase MiaA [Fastidiosipila sp.]|jgi:tRNA dimethylallyltransferase|nr:tRNA (adenosine(37)-N6)-dimethylallyltransferase MiaA [Eubacteriales bacterium]HHU04261.1 tRNA (adenosine(37)-N6)-dimethylallyltransferase MiaA [Fastidiosipila sp.]
MMSNDILLSADSEDLMLELLRQDFSQRDDLIPILTGPTASGKSSLALRWCEAEGRELISADSMQIYRGFDIGTAKPSPEEQDRVVHHLIDIKNADEQYSVAQFVDDAVQIIQEGQTENRRFLICGGSGQYISALVEGLKFSDPPPTAEVRSFVDKKISDYGLEKAYAMLVDLDPIAAEQIAPENRRRIARFFEKYEMSGKTLTELNAESHMKRTPYNYCVYQLNWESRQKLYERINQRAEQMYDSGLIAETRTLMEQYPAYETAPAFRGIGYREAVKFIEGDLTEGEAREQTATATRRYAKRQLTWFRPKNYPLRLQYSKDIP